MPGSRGPLSARNVLHAKTLIERTERAEWLARRAPCCGHHPEVHDPSGCMLCKCTAPQHPSTSANRETLVPVVDRNDSDLDPPGGP